VDGDVLRLVRIRCRHLVPGGTVVAQDVDVSGRVHFALFQSISGGPVQKFAVDPSTGQLVGPGIDEP
jgi:hypothetical protein